MASISLSLTKAQVADTDTFAVTQGTSAPGAGAVELRYDLAVVTERDLLLAIEKLENILQSRGVNLGLPTDIILQP